MVLITAVLTVFTVMQLTMGELRAKNLIHIGESEAPKHGRSVVAALDKKPSAKLIALTFDDGPDTRFTPQVLSILKNKGVKATFFLIGSSVEKNPELTMQIVWNGNEIGNHTYSHADMRKEEWNNTVEEISKAQDVIMSVTGIRTRWFRPPRGEFDQHDVMAAKAMGYKIIMWTVGIENHATKTPQAMVERVLNKVQGGSVILLHDGVLDRSRTVAALPILIDRLKSRGFSFVTVSELLEATGEKKRENLDVISYNKRQPIPERLFPIRTKSLVKKLLYK